MPRSDSKEDAAPVLVLFRHDLRVADNRALYAAARSGRPVLCAFVLDDEAKDHRPLGGARRWWLHHSLVALEKSLKSLGAGLVLRRGAMDEVVADLAATSKAELVLWNRRYDPPGIASDKRLKAALTSKEVECESFDGHLLHEPWQFKTSSGGYYKVYSPFWRALSGSEEPRDPLPAPSRLDGWTGKVRSDDLSDWKLLPTKPDWADGLAETWTPGEAGAQSRLEDFLDGPIRGYAEGRDRPGRESTSRLSPHLCHGEITPFQIWKALARRHGADAETFRKELVWREFNWHLLFHEPELATRNHNPSFDAFAWRRPGKELTAWRKGLTGYPVVDAGMRELWQTGWMHNRVRMIAASFLIKHLLVDWRVGEKWFWDTLVDADPASNPGNWQWVAGSGADAAPYFRIFNPILQGLKFDGDGDYVRTWVPEIAGLPDTVLHKPWEAKKSDLSDAKLKLGETYPVPVVEHQAARDRALEAYKATRGTNDDPSAST